MFQESNSRTLEEKENKYLKRSDKIVISSLIYDPFWTFGGWGEVGGRDTTLDRLWPTRDVHRSLMSALRRTGATATELLNRAASLRWDAAWKSSIFGPDKERRRLDETWWDAYKPSVTVPPRSRRGGIGFPAGGTRLSCQAGGEGIEPYLTGCCDMSIWSFPNLHECSFISS